MLKRLLELFGVSLRLGVTSFGGPIAHLAYFRHEYVERRKWLDEASYADVVALCQFLPGPASSQVGISIGMLRGGFLGGFISWLGFTLPSAVALALFATLLQGHDLSNSGWLRGLLIVAVAVVAHAVWSMATKLAPDPPRAALAIGAAIVMLLAPVALFQIALILLGGVVGWALYRRSEPPEVHAQATTGSNTSALIAWILFGGLLILLPILRQVYEAEWLALFDAFYRVGSLVFGGGHVVLPLLSAEVVGAGWLSGEEFLAGYAAAQAVPGPLFTFSAFLGASMGGYWLGALALAAIFLPSFLLVAGTLPYWETLRRKHSVRAALKGVNAVVVGLLLAALYDPIFTKAVETPGHFALALGAFALHSIWNLPAWSIVLLCALVGPWL